MIVQTVAFPVYKSKKIAWLALEGLCNQRGIDYEWELIICEERHEEQLGSGFFNLYKERLENIGCTRIKYIELDDWIPLSKKWLVIGYETSETSKSFILQAADCYPFDYRLMEANFYINKQEYDWLDYSKGYFYSFNYKKCILYSYNGKTNLNMAFKTKYIKEIECCNKNCGVDGFLLGSIKKKNDTNILTINELKSTGFDTDGLNNISTSRKRAFKNINRQKRKVFKHTDINIKDLFIPEDIKERIYELS